MNINEQYTRVGTQRSGHEYQDLVALDVIVDWLEHPDRYLWVKLEADEAGFLDDIVALRTEGILTVRQVKFSTHPGQADDAWTWEALLEVKEGSRAKSLLGKWGLSFGELRSAHEQIDAAVVSNRRASPELQATIGPEGRVHFDHIQSDVVKEELRAQIGDEALLREFFGAFLFDLDRPGLDEMEDTVRRRFYRNGGTELGWESLRRAVRLWVRLKNEPPPDGTIRLGDVRLAANWYDLQSLSQDFVVPKDYVLPSARFHMDLFDQLRTRSKPLYFLTASPGVGKSTYCSYLTRILKESEVPVIRHHYFLSTADRQGVHRLEADRAAESLMHDLARDYPAALSDKELGRRPAPDDLTDWLIASGRYFNEQAQVLVIILDGLDHVWRERSSMEELERLLQRILPTPDGVVVLLAGQPIDEKSLPRLIIRDAPASEWLTLPQLDLDAVEKWTMHHRDEVGLPRPIDDPDHSHQLVHRIAAAFYRQGGGHPLHLRYALMALLEQQREVTEDTIRELPACAHSDINKYYDELVSRLPDGEMAVLHLLAALTFPWPEEGIARCLAFAGQNLPDVLAGLRQVKHLLVADDLGWRMFHSSLPVYVIGLPEHTLYVSRLKPHVLRWLKEEAPDYWRWAYAWPVEEEEGNDTPLTDGTTRAWVLEAIAQRKGFGQTGEILGRSGWASFMKRDFAVAVATGILRDYTDEAHADSDELEATMLYGQLVVEEDPHLLPRLRSWLRGLGDDEIALVAEAEYRHGNVTVIRRCEEELIRRLQEGKTRLRQGIFEDWRESIRYWLSCLALASTNPAEEIAEVAGKNRENGLSADIVRLSAEVLRVTLDVGAMRRLLTLSLSMPSDETEHAFRHGVMLAIEQGVNLDEIVASAPTNAYTVLYRHLRGIETSDHAAIPLPVLSAEELRGIQFSQRESETTAFFCEAFYGLLANHLSNNGGRNQAWPYEIDLPDWPRALLFGLNRLALHLSQLLSAGTEDISLRFVSELSTLPPPSLEERRDYNTEPFIAGAQRAVTEIALDIVGIKTAGLPLGRTILEAWQASGWFEPEVWTSSYVRRRRTIFERGAILDLLRRQVAMIDGKVEVGRTRALKFARWSAVASLHGAKDEAAALFRSAASNMVTHGYHKDMLFFQVLEVLRLLADQGLIHEREWIAAVAAPAAHIGDYTDSDHTRYLPHVLGSILVDLAPDLLPPYYQWLTERADFWDAERVLHSFVERADLSDPVNLAVVTTAIDDESLTLLQGRADAGDEGARSALDVIRREIGVVPPPPKPDPYAKSTEEQVADPSESGSPPKRFGRTETPPEAADYPPDRYSEWSEALRQHHLYSSSFLADWIAYWRGQGRSSDVLEIIEQAEERGARILDYDAVFKLALDLKGAKDAYTWLVKAQIDHSGWMHFHGIEDARERWRIVKDLYPDRWFEFLRDSLFHWTGGPLGDFVMSHMWVPRIVEYLLYMEQSDYALAAGTGLLTVACELMSPLPLLTPPWVPNE